MSHFLNRSAVLALVAVLAATAGCCARPVPPPAAPVAPVAVIAPVQPPAPLPPQKVSDPAYVVASGDVLGVRIYEEKDLSGDYTVGANGHVSLPLIGALDIGGKTLGQVRDAIARAYQQGYLKNPKISVEATRQGG